MMDQIHFETGLPTFLLDVREMQPACGSEVLQRVGIGRIFQKGLEVKPSVSLEDRAVCHDKRLFNR